MSPVAQSPSHPSLIEPFGLLGPAIVIGILLATFVVGSIIASVLLILLAVVFIIWLARRPLFELKGRL